MTLDYLFGKNISSVLPKKGFHFEISKKTKRIRHVYHNKELFGTFRPDGTIALTIYAAKLLSKHPAFKNNCIIINDEVKEFAKGGRAVFAKHVVSAGESIRPNSEVVVLDSEGDVIAVGRAILPSLLMTSIRRGVAVKVRKGIDD
jgi:predicted RNA-binding protein (TIGR00451 family)